ncbi:MAG: hypothetical protein NTW17_00450 [Candidatus Pacearchaeota archaeon]|nr:hypothetical protein [Candidatus Pacearchaeota archaeon]
MRNPRHRALKQNPARLSTPDLTKRLSDAVYCLKAIDSVIAKGHHAHGGNMHTVRRTLRTLIPKYEAEHNIRGINYVPYCL